MHITLRNSLEALKRTPNSRLPKLVEKRPVYYVNGRKGVLCHGCANAICSDWTDNDSPLDIPVEFHVSWFTEHRCSVCDDLIEGVYNE